MSIAWDPPEKTKQNDIISYTACVSHSENGPCFQTFIASESKWLIGNLNASTEYYVRVLVTTKVGGGSYSESKRFFTNASKYMTCSDFHIYHCIWVTFGNLTGEFRFLNRSSSF